MLLIPTCLINKETFSNRVPQTTTMLPNKAGDITLPWQTFTLRNSYYRNRLKQHLSLDVHG